MTINLLELIEVTACNVISDQTKEKKMKQILGKN